MRLTPAARLLLLTASLAAASLTTSGCTGLLGDFTTGKEDASAGGEVEAGSDSTAGTDGGGNGEDAGGADAGLALGTACTADAQCAAGHCTDGVCCESACSGVCETCKASASPGRCVPIPANTDPDLECVTAPAPDAGVSADSGPTGDAAGGAADASEASSADAGGADAASPDSGASDGAVFDAPAEVGFNVPDGGVMSSNAACAGSCNGMRACAFPGRTTTCGTEFCNTTTQSGRFACDGTGNCSIDLESCTNYACTGTGCGTSCAAPSDCLDTAFCNNSGVCQPRLGNGISCSLGNQCQSENCVQGVCCSSACNIPGGTCTASGAIGQCQCSVSCGDGGSCQLFYRDSDGDGYGDATGTIANTNAKVGCSGAPPAGFVADNTDCDDHDANVHPGQTSYFGTPSHGVGTYDYDCDGTLEKSEPEFPGGYCQFCGGTAPACTESYTCGAASDQAAFDCTSHFRFICSIITHLCSSYSYCSYNHASAFGSTIACGAYGTYTSCGTCAAASGSASTSTSSVQQQCH